MNSVCLFVGRIVFCYLCCVVVVVWLFLCWLVFSVMFVVACIEDCSRYLIIVVYVCVVVCLSLGACFSWLLFYCVCCLCVVFVCV